MEVHVVDAAGRFARKLRGVVVVDVVFAIMQRRGVTVSASLDPTDPDSPNYLPDAAATLTGEGGSS